jgi:hypothetical protein
VPFALQAMDSEENRAAMIVLQTWCQLILSRTEATNGRSAPEWHSAEMCQRIAWVLRFLVTVSPVSGPKAPLVRNQAKDLLDKLEAAKVVGMWYE